MKSAASNPPFLRMFAGPNGSGKSTMKNALSNAFLGFYINPDDIESLINKNRCLNFGIYNIQVEFQNLREFIKVHPLAAQVELKNIWAVEAIKNLAGFKTPVNPYLVSILSDFIRREFLKTKQSFSFETVMSSPDKIDFLKEAKAAGFRVHLYFVATEDALINVSRVRNRVAKGGHNVPEDKIIARYERTLSMLRDAVVNTHKALVFDNSERELRLIAEVKNGKKITLKTDRVPQWIVKYLLEI